MKRCGTRNRKGFEFGKFVLSENAISPGGRPLVRNMVVDIGGQVGTGRVKPSVDCGKACCLLRGQDDFATSSLAGIPL